MDAEASFLAQEAEKPFEAGDERLFLTLKWV
jgi:hypothetical protein